MSGWRLKIAHKLPLALIGSALIACLCVGAGSYFVADRSVAGLTQEKMETMAQERARELGDYFAAAKEDLLVSAGSSNTVTALKGMKMGWAQMVENQGSQLIELYVTNNPFGENERQLFDQSESLASYNRTHGRYHPGFRNQAATRGYDDVYLFDVEGNLLYSVMKRADFGANVAADPAWSVTPLGQAFRAAVGLTEPGSIVFIDSLPYLGTAGCVVRRGPGVRGQRPLGRPRLRVVAHTCRGDPRHAAGPWRNRRDVPRRDRSSLPQRLSLQRRERRSPDRLRGRHRGRRLQLRNRRERLGVGLSRHGHAGECCPAEL